jgi:hypothetical protein
MQERDYAKERRNKPRIGGTVEKRNAALMRRWAEQSGLTMSRILDELIQHGANSGYRPGHVSIPALRQEARDSINRGGG